MQTKVAVVAQSGRIRETNSISLDRRVRHKSKALPHCPFFFLWTSESILTYLCHLLVLSINHLSKTHFILDLDTFCICEQVMRVFLLKYSYFFLKKTSVKQLLAPIQICSILSFSFVAKLCGINSFV